MAGTVLSDIFLEYDEVDLLKNAFAQAGLSLQAANENSFIVRNGSDIVAAFEVACHNEDGKPWDIHFTAVMNGEKQKIFSCDGSSGILIEDHTATFVQNFV
jgi:hypothetical protein